MADLFPFRLLTTPAFRKIQRVSQDLYGIYRRDSNINILYT